MTEPSAANGSPSEAPREPPKAFASRQRMAGMVQVVMALVLLQGWFGPINLIIPLPRWWALPRR